MRYQFKDHSLVVAIPDKYQHLFVTEEQIADLRAYLLALPQFQDVNEEGAFLPILGSILSPRTMTISSFDLALMEMMSNGTSTISDTTLLIYLTRKVKELELFLTSGAMPGKEPEKKSGGLIL